MGSACTDDQLPTSPRGSPGTHPDGFYGLSGSTPKKTSSEPHISEWSPRLTTEGPLNEHPLAGTPQGRDAGPYSAAAAPAAVASTREDDDTPWVAPGCMS
jgi:hypothetical protein